ncbi:hypothetical protein [Streptomyces mesophilus]|uniref:hypothetical protein n=1 Tax=Streptomyces mesophilus TaxID=1775132 RepID=UPI001F2B3A80|nr:hypothetical protein [Streptomyces mesophilus]
MARDYDSQLLESVSVRRRRLRDALLFGAQRARRSADERLGKVFAGIAIAAVLCAGCVGWSFVQNMMEKQKDEQRKQQQKQEKLVGHAALQEARHFGHTSTKGTANNPPSASTSR